jgi:signal transduction histidine kinase/ActR/RegA family two-component response regulator
VNRSSAPPRRLSKGWPLALAVFLSAFAIGADAAAQNPQKRVLVLHSARRDAQLTVTLEARLPSLLESGLPEGLDYYAEYLDQARFSREEYPNTFRDFLQQKYQELDVDAIIPVGKGAIEFLLDNRDVLFGDTPLVFYTTAPPSRPLANSTGIVNVLRFDRSVDLALTLQPDLQHLFVVSGAAPADQRADRQARAEFGRFEDRLQITYLSGLVTGDLETRLRAVPPHSAVFFTLVSQDGRGEKFHTTEYLARVASVANAPTYGWVDISTEPGIVGGNRRNQLAQTKALADLTLRVLRGEQADAIPVSTLETDVVQIDWRQLRRWGISEARVPPGTIVLFREPTIWDRYKTYILAALALVVTQSALIAGLLIQRQRRRRAEEELRGSQGELRRSYERNRDLGARLLRAQEDERSLIARELHDDIGQQVALLTIELSLLGRAKLDEADNLAKEALSHAQNIARSVQDLSRRVHPTRLRVLGLVPALEALRDEVSRNGMEIRFTHDNVPTTLPGDLTLCLFRVVQEALQNALKHSKANEASVHLTGERGVLALSIADDGVGFDVDDAVGRGLGLISMNERLDAIGGSLEIRSKQGAGTALEIRVPLDLASRAATAVRVLLVDDNDAMLDRTSDVLTPACVIAGKVHDGKAALKAAEALRPDVIVLDISMPDMTGLEVARHLRDAGSTAALVFLTAYDDQAYERAARALGATGYVLKSQLASDLLPAVQDARGRRQTASAVR